FGNQGDTAGQRRAQRWQWRSSSGNGGKESEQDRGNGKRRDEEGKEETVHVTAKGSIPVRSSIVASIQHCHRGIVY
ncbi:hypothetical protein HN51_050891, partial [Arachis hypogaea]